MDGRENPHPPEAARTLDNIYRPHPVHQLGPIPGLEFLATKNALGDPGARRQIEPGISFLALRRYFRCTQGSNRYLYSYPLSSSATTIPPERQDDYADGTRLPGITSPYTVPVMSASLSRLAAIPGSAAVYRRASGRSKLAGVGSGWVAAGTVSGTAGPRTSVLEGCEMA
jgi:hypothetical protein